MVTDSYQKLFELSVDMMGIANNDGYFEVVNPSVTSILGYTEEEFTAEPFLNFVHPDDIAPTLAEFEATQGGKHILHFTNRYRHKDGHYVLLAWTTTPDVKAGLYYAVARDITDTLSIKNRLKAIEGTVSSETIMAITDKHGVITDVNQQFCDISGYTAEELIGNTHSMVNSGTHPPEFFKELWQTISSGDTWSGLIVNRRKSGDLYYVHSVITPILDVEGNIETYLAMRFDASDFYETKAELDKTLSILNETGRIAKVGGWEMHIESDDLIWTDETYSILEVEKPPGVLPKLSEGLVLFTEEYQPVMARAVDRCVNHGEPYSLEVMALTAKGNRLWVYTNGKPNYRDGKIYSISGTIQDIHDRKTAEIKYDFERQKSIHNAKLASLGELAASIGHEINNPLAIVKGTNFLINKYKESPEKISGYVKEIDNSCDRISHIVTGLKKFVRMNEETFLEAKSFAGIVDESLMLTKSKLRRHQVQVDYKNGSGGQIYCDEIEIEQVLVNLINNAIDAIKSLDDKWLELKLEEHDDFMRLRITDSGDGIPELMQEKIFEPFFTSKDSGEGTGLGLSIVKEIVDEHKGKIYIDNNNKNTCFVLEFPIYAGNID